MRVFVTGATGFIGSAVVRELQGAGHEVVGLARSDEAERALVAAGVEPHRGSVDDLAALQAGAGRADGVIHLAFANDFVDYAAASEADRRAVEAMASALEGSNKPLVVTSGTLALAFTSRVGTEEDALDPALPRVASEHAALAFADRGVRSSIVRLAPCVHDETRAGLATRLTELARESGVSAYVGDGANRWPGVHRLDAARLFLLALEDAAPGERLHAVEDEGVPLRAIAEAIGRRAGVPVASIDADAAADHFGFFSMMIGLDNPTSSALTRARHGWEPVQPDLLTDLGG